MQSAAADALAIVVFAMEKQRRQLYGACSRVCRAPLPQPQTGKGAESKCSRARKLVSVHIEMSLMMKKDPWDPTNFLSCSPSWCRSGTAYLGLDGGGVTDDERGGGG